MKNIVYGGCLALAITAAAGAQDKGPARADHGSHMPAGQTYSGCLDRTENGTFVLTQVAAPKEKGAKTGRTMKDDGMMNDGMKKDGMKKDGMRKDAMMKMAAAPDTVHVSSTSVDLASHVGQKVSVAGTRGEMEGMVELAVTSLKTVAKSCG